MNIWSQLPKPFFVLAPMDDVTDTVFRRVVTGCAKPDLFITEFVNVDGLQSVGRPALLKKLKFSGGEQPIIAQIWGKVPVNFYKTAQELVEMGFAGIDVNMGCPVRAVVKNGCCSALIDNRELAAEIISATQEGTAGRIPVSVKTRLGTNKIDYSWHEFLLGKGLDAIIVHGRTAKSMSDSPADWAAIGHIRAIRDEMASKAFIVGNGDVMSRGQGLTLAQENSLDGIMVGRGVFSDPFVFSQDSPWQRYTKQQKIELYRLHIELFASTWKNNERPIKTLNRFCKIYINGFDGAKELRDKLMNSQSISQLLELLLLES